MSVQQQIGSGENYRAYTNIPNTIELVASWDIPIEEPTLAFGGVKGCLDKLCITRIFPAIYRIQYQDVFQTEPYPPGTTQPVTVETAKPIRRNTKKVSHVQVSLSNWNTDGTSTSPTNHRARVWWYLPELFPAEMALADPIYNDSIIVSIYDPESDTLSEPQGMRANIMVTLVETADDAFLVPKE